MGEKNAVACGLPLNDKCRFYFGPGLKRFQLVFAQNEDSKLINTLNRYDIDAQSQGGHVLGKCDFIVSPPSPYNR